PIAVSVVVPAHDEAPNLVRLVAEVRASLDPLGIAWELIVVDDGSDDDTPALLAQLAEADHRLRPLRLARRSGQTAALVAGFRAARGRLIATLDADLQCAPAELPALLAALERADLACGVRTHRNDPPSRRLASALALLALAAFPFVYALGRWPLIEPDEGRNAEVAREMLALGQWSVPHLNGLPYLDKPVLLFWMIAGAFRVLGVSELAARLPSVLGALATVLFTYDLVRVLAGRRRALLAAAVLATAPIVLAYARLVIFDMPLTALVTAALDCLVRARTEGNAWRWLPLAGLAMGLATLTKGPVGIAVPLLAWLAARGALARPARRSGAGPILAGVAVAALVVVPWLAVVMRQQPDFLRYALLDETLLRLSSTARFHRGGHVYFYLETLAWAFGMWGALLGALAPALVRRW